MTKKELDRAQVLRAPIDQRRLGPPHRVRGVRRWIQSQLIDPVAEDARVLASSKMRRPVQRLGKRKSSDLSPACLIHA